MANSIKMLFLADTHLGFDFPLKPRIQRRRRGADFFANYKKALEPARKGEVDLIIHGGDMFFRSRVPPKIVSMGFEPLREIADSGIPVYIVPGNHERSWIPASLFDTHRLIHIFEKPKTYYFTKRGFIVALAGFPCLRNGIYRNFKKLVEQTGYNERDSDVRILCMHQSVEGARVGVQNYAFRDGTDIIPGKDISDGFDAVLSGHIHRGQALKYDLRGNPLGAPVIYPGATERTSFAEREEEKGYVLLEVISSTKSSKPKIKWAFKEIPTRPMKVILVPQNDFNEKSIKIFLEEEIFRLDSNAVVQIKFEDSTEPKILSFLNVEYLRSIAPETMNISVALRSYLK